MSSDILISSTSGRALDATPVSVKHDEVSKSANENNQNSGSSNHFSDLKNNNTNENEIKNQENDKTSARPSTSRRKHRHPHSKHRLTHEERMARCSFTVVKTLWDVEPDEVHLKRLLRRGRIKRVRTVDHTKKDNEEIVREAQTTDNQEKLPNFLDTFDDNQKNKTTNESNGNNKQNLLDVFASRLSMGSIRSSENEDMQKKAEPEDHQANIPTSKNISDHGENASNIVRTDEDEKMPNFLDTFHDTDKAQQQSVENNKQKDLPNMLDVFASRLSMGSVDAHHDIQTNHHEEPSQFLPQNDNNNENENQKGKGIKIEGVLKNQNDNNDNNNNKLNENKVEKHVTLIQPNEEKLPNLLDTYHDIQKAQEEKEKALEEECVNENKKSDLPNMLDVFASRLSMGSVGDEQQQQQHLLADDLPKSEILSNKNNEEASSAKSSTKSTVFLTESTPHTSSEGKKEDNQSSKADDEKLPNLLDTYHDIQKAQEEKENAQEEENQKKRELPNMLDVFASRLSMGSVHSQPTDNVKHVTIETPPQTDSAGVRDETKTEEIPEGDEKLPNLLDTYHDIQKAQEEKENASEEENQKKRELPNMLDVFASRLSMGSVHSQPVNIPVEGNEEVEKVNEDEKVDEDEKVNEDETVLVNNDSAVSEIFEEEENEGIPFSSPKGTKFVMASPELPQMENVAYTGLLTLLVVPPNEAKLQAYFAKKARRHHRSKIKKVRVYDHTNEENKQYDIKGLVGISKKKSISRHPVEDDTEEYMMSDENTQLKNAIEEEGKLDELETKEYESDALREALMEEKHQRSRQLCKEIEQEKIFESDVLKNNINEEKEEISDIESEFEKMKNNEIDELDREIEYEYEYISESSDNELNHNDESEALLMNVYDEKEHITESSDNELNHNNESDALAKNMNDELEYISESSDNEIIHNAESESFIKNLDDEKEYISDLPTDEENDNEDELNVVERALYEEKDTIEIDSDLEELEENLKDEENKEYESLFEEEKDTIMIDSDLEELEENLKDEENKEYETLFEEEKDTIMIDSDLEELEENLKDEESKEYETLFEEEKDTIMIDSDLEELEENLKDEEVEDSKQFRDEERSARALDRAAREAPPFEDAESNVESEVKDASEIDEKPLNEKSDAGVQAIRMDIDELLASRKSSRVASPRSTPRSPRSPTATIARTLLNEFESSDNEIADENEEEKDVEKKPNLEQTVGTIGNSLIDGKPIDGNEESGNDSIPEELASQSETNNESDDEFKQPSQHVLIGEKEDERYERPITTEKLKKMDISVITTPTGNKKNEIPLIPNEPLSSSTSGRIRRRVKKSEKYPTKQQDNTSSTTPKSQVESQCERMRLNTTRPTNEPNFSGPKSPTSQRSSPRGIPVSHPFSPRNSNRGAPNSPRNNYNSNYTNIDLSDEDSYTYRQNDKGFTTPNKSFKITMPDLSDSDSDNLHSNVRNNNNNNTYSNSMYGRPNSARQPAGMMSRTSPLGSPVIKTPTSASRRSYEPQISPLLERLKERAYRFEPLIGASSDLLDQLLYILNQEKKMLARERLFKDGLKCSAAIAHAEKFLERAKQRDEEDMMLNDMSFDYTKSRSLNTSDFSPTASSMLSPKQKKKKGQVEQNMENFDKETQQKEEEMFEKQQQAKTDLKTTQKRELENLDRLWNSTAMKKHYNKPSKRLAALKNKYNEKIAALDTNGLGKIIQEIERLKVNEEEVAHARMQQDFDEQLQDLVMKQKQDYAFFIETNRIKNEKFKQQRAKERRALEFRSNKLRSPTASVKMNPLNEICDAAGPLHVSEAYEDDILDNVVKNPDSFISRIDERSFRDDDESEKLDLPPIDNRRSKSSRAVIYDSS